MKWLILSESDLETGMGGVETHARCVARELRKMGVDVSFSTSVEDFNKIQPDVVQTHGSQIRLSPEVLKSLKKTVWFHTLHGWTLERMIACREPLWLGGYRAFWTEIRAARAANHCFSIHGALRGVDHPDHFSICGNGWDAWTDEDPLNQDFSTFRGKFLFLGRGEDKMKGVWRLRNLPGSLKLVAVPGRGFEGWKNVEKTGVFSATQIRHALLQSRGLVIPSLYEGLPLVALEALSLGVPVVATPVGGLPTLSKEIRALRFCRKDAKDLVELMETLPMEESSQTRAERALENRRFLRTWKDVALSYLSKAREFVQNA